MNNMPKIICPKCGKMYRNREWLKQKYIDERLSTTQISKLCNSGNTVIANWLHRLNISICSCSKAIHLRKTNHCSLSEKSIEWINGELLGDGSLESSCIYSARFVYTSQYPEYIRYVSDALKSYNILGKIYKCKNKKSGNYDYSFHGITYAELLPIRNQWYPNGKKIIPRDIVLTPLVCRQWYIGDGFLTHTQKGTQYIRLSTDDFLQEDINWLIKELLKIGFKATIQPSSNRIIISVYSTKAFLKYIGDCPVECYQYKWNYIKGVKNDDTLKQFAENAGENM